MEGSTPHRSLSITFPRTVDGYVRCHPPRNARTVSFLIFFLTGVRPGHRRGEADVLHAHPPVRRDRGLPRAVDDLFCLHGLHGGREELGILAFSTMFGSRLL